jgi:hypothetical protein
MAFLNRYHWLVAVLLFVLAAVLYLLGYRAGAVVPLLAGVLVEGVAWITLVDGGSRERTGEERRH